MHWQWRSVDCFCPLSAYCRPFVAMGRHRYGNPLARAAAIPGTLHEENSRALDEYEGLVAYGCQNVVAVVEAGGGMGGCTQLLTTLDGPGGDAARVCEVRWAPRLPTRCALQSDDHRPMLASADTSGFVGVWDVCAAERLSLLPPPARGAAVARLHWLPAGGGMLLIAYSTSQMRMWRVNRSAKDALVWECELPEPPALLAVEGRGGAGRLAALATKGTIVQLCGLRAAAPPAVEAGALG